MSVALVSTVAATIGWMWKDEGHLTPELGIGYWLGIAGATAMLALLVYPLRKRMPALWWLGSISAWFRIHMLLGTLGPLLILYHCNFSFGAINSTVALVTMLVVAGSGLVGRYLYGKIHLGLDGHKATAAQLLEDAEGLRLDIGEELSDMSSVLSPMQSLQARVAKPSSGLAAATWALVRLRAHVRRDRRAVMQQAEAVVAAAARANGQGWLARRRAVGRVRRLLDRYFSALQRAAAFAMFERLFAMWHVLHLPLFILLVLAVIAHIVAVHQF